MTIAMNWSTNLIEGEIIFFKSEKKPIKKITITTIPKILKSCFIKYIIDKKIITPPIKGVLSTGINS
tara:strand:+ start:289 stop:489 length:201 start_codon:yes stop_codon:yes gene_type:complete